MALFKNRHNDDELDALFGGDAPDPAKRSPEDTEASENPSEKRGFKITRRFIIGASVGLAVTLGSLGGIFAYNAAKTLSLDEADASFGDMWISSNMPRATNASLSPGLPTNIALAQQGFLWSNTDSSCRANWSIKAYANEDGSMGGATQGDQESFVFPGIANAAVERLKPVTVKMDGDDAIAKVQLNTLKYDEKYDYSDIHFDYGKKPVDYDKVFPESRKGYVAYRYFDVASTFYTSDGGSFLANPVASITLTCDNAWPSEEQWEDIVESATMHTNGHGLGTIGMEESQPSTEETPANE